MSDTLRTDALISRHTEESMRLITTSDHQLVSHALRQTRELIEHARELERECAECEALRKDAERWRYIEVEVFEIVKARLK